MGLLDVINGMRNGPGGLQAPSSSSGGMSPITMAIMALLAYKGIKHLGGSGAGQAQAPAGSTGGGLGGMLGGLLGGGSGGAGGGLGGLLRQNNRAARFRSSRETRDLDPIVSVLNVRQAE